MSYAIVGDWSDRFVFRRRRLGRLGEMDELGGAGKRTKPEDGEDHLAGSGDSLGCPDGMAKVFRGRNRKKYGLSERNRHAGEHSYHRYDTDN